MNNCRSFRYLFVQIDWSLALRHYFVSFSFFKKKFPALAQLKMKLGRKHFKKCICHFEVCTHIRARFYVLPKPKDPVYSYHSHANQWCRQAIICNNQIRSHWIKKQKKKNKHNNSVTDDDKKNPSKSYFFFSKFNRKLLSKQTTGKKNNEENVLLPKRASQLNLHIFSGIGSLTDLILCGSLDLVR